MQYYTDILREGLKAGRIIYRKIMAYASTHNKEMPDRMMIP